jgi:hypothetical protein
MGGCFWPVDLIFTVAYELADRRLFIASVALEVGGIGACMCPYVDEYPPLLLLLLLLKNDVELRDGCSIQCGRLEDKNT